MANFSVLTTRYNMIYHNPSRNQLSSIWTEGESELISIFNIVYATGPLALLFLAEYANIIVIFWQQFYH